MTADDLAIRRDLRSAFLAQALMLAASLSVIVLLWFFGDTDDSVFAFGAVSTAAAVVLCLWSLFLSIRAARAGAAWRSAGILWALTFVELLAPAVVYLSFFGSRFQTNPVLIVLFICVGGPCLAVTELYVIAVAVLTRTWPRRKLMITLLTAAYLPVPLALAPAAMLLFAVLNQDRLANESTARAVVAAIPQPFRDEVDRILERGESYGQVMKWRLYLSYHGRLSHQRVMENLYNSAHPDVAYYTWYSLDRVRHAEAVQVALDVGTGRLPALAAQASEPSVVALIAANGSLEDIATVLNHRQMFSRMSQTNLLQALHVHPERPLEHITMRRLCTDPEVLGAAQEAHDGYLLQEARRLGAPVPNDDGLGSIYLLWSLGKRTPSDVRGLAGPAKRCRKSDNPILRRLAATAIADILHRETRHIPFADALTPDGKPVPVTLEETEEIEQLCNAAKAEADKLALTPKK